MTNTKISFNPASIARCLGITAFVLVLISTATELADFSTGHNSVYLHKLVTLFYVELELNVPAFFSMLLLLTASLLLATVSVLTRKKNVSHVLEWTILSAGFLLMAFDEIVAFHELLIEPMRTILGENNLGIFYFAWVIPAIGLVLFLAVCFLKFLLSLPAKTRFCFLLAATLYLGAAIGFEFIEGSHVELHGKDNLFYITLTTIEESLEMAGIIIFIRALLSHIGDNFGEVRLQFDSFLTENGVHK